MIHFAEPSPPTDEYRPNTNWLTTFKRTSIFCMRQVMCHCQVTPTGDQVVYGSLVPYAVLRLKPVMVG